MAAKGISERTRDDSDQSYRDVQRIKQEKCSISGKSYRRKDISHWQQRLSAVGLGRSNEAAAAADLSAKSSFFFTFFDEEVCFDDIGAGPDTMGVAALMADPERGEALAWASSISGRTNYDH